MPLEITGIKCRVEGWTVGWMSITGDDSKTVLVDWRTNAQEWVELIVDGGEVVRTSWIERVSWRMIIVEGVRHGLGVFLPDMAGIPGISRHRLLNPT